MKQPNLSAPPRRYAEFIGSMPPGDWAMARVAYTDGTEVILLVDRTGNRDPRIVIDGRIEMLG